VADDDVTFSANERRELVISDGATFGVASTFRPLGLQVRSVITIGDVGVALLAPPPSAGEIANLVAVSRTGDVIWMLHPPTGDPQDHFVRVEPAGETVVAWSWSCFRYVIATPTGRILEGEFVK